MSYLFDTDTLSNPLKKRPSLALLQRLASTPAEEQFTSAITVGEMIYGAHKSTRAEYFIEQLNTKVWPSVSVVPFDTDAADIYGKLRAHLERRGTPLAEPDLRIAATALAHGLTLVTAKTDHFSRIPGLAVENWLE